MMRKLPKDHTRPNLDRANVSQLASCANRNVVNHKLCLLHPRDPISAVIGNLQSALSAPHRTFSKARTVICNQSPGTSGPHAAQPLDEKVPFKKILCANRGEISIRVFRAGAELGLRTVAVYSPADRLQPHRYKADEAYQVGTPELAPVACYLDIDSIIKVAKDADVDAIHPGYGFLSENATFARKCAEAGITFVGPLPETIEAMGDKTAARRAAVECGVAVVPGTNQPIADAEEAIRFAKEYEFPVMLKAAMGGGGRGMRVVKNGGPVQPDTGRLEDYRVPGGPGIRLDGAFTTGNVVSRYYDSLLAKVIASAPTFPKAIQKMQRALAEFQVRGIKTNIPFLENVLRHPEFLEGKATTYFIEKNAKDLFSFETHGSLRSSKMLLYLAEQVVNGPNHPGAVGSSPPKIRPVIPSVPPHLAQQQPRQRWRDVFLKEGPESWSKAVRAHQGVLLTDTTMRDAHQSLLATRMRTTDMLKVAPATAAVLAKAGSLEMWGGATFDVALRFLHECPWRRLEKLRELIPNVPFQMLIRGANAVGYTSYPDNVVNEFVLESRKAGIDIFRVFDSLNYVDNLKFGIDSVVKAGGIAEATLCYTGDLMDPTRTKYNLDYYLTLADQLVDHGVHSLAIKDMAGLLKPQAATMLVGALRSRFPNVPIHVHTHDSAGTAVATQLAAAAAGADMIDCCFDSMSGLTSQPSMGAIVNALHGTKLDTGIDPSLILPLSTYWEETRELYSPFESNMKAVSSDVYKHEMPGGQYTNLKFQAASLGLGKEWDRICTSYAAANRALGDIVKVTPSSKVVGDLAQFMVQNDLDEFTLVERADSLSLPSSVVEFFQGYLGQPPSWPEPLRSKVIKGKKVIEGRPGASMPSLDLNTMEHNLKDKYGSSNITKRDVLSSAMYPKVFEEYMDFSLRYSQLIEKLPTRAFLAPMDEDEEIEVELAKGVAATLKYKAMGELQDNGKREVFFEANGVPRVVEVIDRAAEQALGKKAVRERADLVVLGSVGAPMSGTIIEVQVKTGSIVQAGQQLVIMSAMKMETAVCAPIGGVITQVAVEPKDTLDAGDLIVYIDTTAVSAAMSNPVDTLDSEDEEVWGRAILKVEMRGCASSIALLPENILLFKTIAHSSILRSNQTRDPDREEQPPEKSLRGTWRTQMTPTKT
ncbi:hypothetical protein CEUSTIGMA_g5241.t1 [Chlamydomonas eustigma]|uniref:Pyruvate carboxylase n=1 Tax=Chlamydomonas eustigma TaxID=1157962 RepID=A0A250X3Z4_9CHLO|nr:hypothetical protein CEUSTIGMA_g5241.t1 [Chlamydomonas eustigma]|eukprot:GAX77798.1 hypothetical protein CEUSTIGMA_g5241.t1 [Chlamydomonas eustigma]